MALLSRGGATKILSRIMETGGFTEDMANDIKRLQDDFDEREGILKEFGEAYDGEDDEYEYTRKSVIDGAEDYKVKYEDMKQKYLDRFFGGVSEKKEEIKEETEEDVKRDGTEQTYDDLFEKREG